MTITKKILVLGIGQSNFLNQLYGGLLEKNPDYAIDIDGLRDISGHGDSGTSIYSGFYDFKKRKPGRFSVYKTFFALSFTSLFWEILFFEKSQKKGFLEVIHLLLHYSWAKCIVDQFIVPLRHDIYHFHFCTPDNLKYLHFLPSHAKVVCSFWGSDLMRNTGVSNVFYVGKALGKAKVVTIQSQELAEIAACKYGRQLREKIRIARFTINTAIYEMIDHLKNDAHAIESFKDRFKIPSDRIIVCVGHNAFAENNHIAILKSINELDGVLKKKIAVVVPLGYGRDASYLEKLDQVVKGLEELHITMLHDFFEPKSTALLRICSDIMIQMPVSDALSGAMTEVMYAENQVVAASWLPYGVLRRNGISFFEAEHFGDLPEVISKLIHENVRIKVHAHGNGEKIRRFLFPESTTKSWADIFAEVGGIK